MHNVEEKMLNANLKDGMIMQTKTKHWGLGLHMISAKCDGTLKTTLG
jgi:hypothetical protein